MKFLFEILKFLCILVLPFILLIRGAVYVHDKYDLLPWISLLSGVAMASIVLFLYFNIVYGRLSGKLGSWAAIKKRGFLAFILVLFYAGHGLFYFSGSNFKSKALSSEIREVHPILRLSISTLIHIDKDLIVTDAQRLPEDYRKMGLKSKQNSLHYRQSNGYTHALDIRTNSRHEFRNQLVRFYFKAMGFNTLRHSGSGTTGDHLHVSLKSHDRPYAI
ncbi:MAG: hypothetical protein HKN09_01215 [Saprospiraceae bacterium]|nr:hypothetical protein [Saprospiraceae bacterium]